MSTQYGTSTLFEEHLEETWILLIFRAKYAYIVEIMLKYHEMTISQVKYISKLCPRYYCCNTETQGAEAANYPFCT